MIGFIRKELIQTLRDRKMWVLLFVAPIIQLTMFGLAITTEVKNIRIAFQYPPQDVLAAKIQQKAMASGWFNSEEPPEVVVIAPDRGLHLPDIQLQLLIDATNMTRARSIENYVGSIVDSTVSEEALSQGLSMPAPPFRINTRILYNPGLESAVFMVPAVMTMLINLVTVLLTSMSLAKEKELGTIETIIASPLSKLEILGGKTLPFCILASLNFPLIMIVANLGFGVPIRGSLAWLFASALVYVFTTVSIGIFISTLARNQQQAMMGGFIYMLPSILLSGAFFPIENMPFWIKPLAYINPQTYFLAILRNLLLKGGSLELVIPDISILLGLGICIFGLSVVRFKEQLV